MYTVLPIQKCLLEIHVAYRTKVQIEKVENTSQVIVIAVLQDVIPMLFLTNKIVMKENTSPLCLPFIRQ